MNRLVQLLAGLCCLLFSTIALAALPGGISGHWFNPDQSGHGLTVNLVSPEFAVVVWYVFDTDGNPLTLYMEGEVSDRSIDATAYAPRGMVFGEFDPTTLELPVWGQVSITFHDCRQAELEWDADDPAYGSGTMPIRRLAFVHGVDCNLPPPNSIASGLYTGQIYNLSEGQEFAENFEGVVDLEGRLWGMERGFYPIPSPIWVGGRLPRVVIAEPVDDNQSDGDIALEGRASVLTWTFNNNPSHRIYDGSGNWPASTVGGELTWFEDETEWALNWEPAAADGKSLVAPLDRGLLAGRYRVPMDDQAPGFVDARLEIDARGHVCIDMSPWYEPSGVCHFRGDISLADGEAGLIDFEIRGPGFGYPLRQPYRGRGWMTESPEGIELILVGDNGASGFGLVAEPEE